MAPTRHLIVGAGTVGSTTAALLAERGEHVLLVSRSGSGPELPGVERVAADASDADGLAMLAEGAAAVYNCANPDYTRWPTDWPPIAHALIVAAERSGAVLATVSNLYAYGPVVGPITEQTPLGATGEKLSVRKQMWLDVLAAHEAGRIRATEVRGSDYILANDQSAMGDRMLSKLVAGKNIQVIGATDEPHTWTSTQDVARLLVTVAADERAWGKAWHVPSNEPRTQRQVVLDYARLGGIKEPKVSSTPAVMLKAVGLFMPVVRELKATAYQWDRPFVMDSSAAQETFGLHPEDWDGLLSRTLSDYRSAASLAA
jgi:nucleoside-diphosphate-sugar epimerase